MLIKTRAFWTPGVKGGNQHCFVRGRSAQLPANRIWHWLLRVRYQQRNEAIKKGGIKGLIKVRYVETLTYSDVIRCDPWVNQKGPYLKTEPTITESDKATESKLRLSSWERPFIFFPQDNGKIKERRDQYVFYQLSLFGWKKTQRNYTTGKGKGIIKKYKLASVA